VDVAVAVKAVVKVAVTVTASVVASKALKQALSLKRNTNSASKGAGANILSGASSAFL
jgi:hypothetical protein